MYLCKLKFNIFNNFSSIDEKPCKKFKKDQGYEELDFEKIFHNGTIQSVKCKLCSYVSVSLSKERMYLHQ